MKSTLFTADSASVSLETQMAQLALEAQFMQNVAELFRTIIPSFKNRLEQLHRQLNEFTQRGNDLDLIANYDAYATNVRHTDRRTQKALDNVRHYDLLTFGERLVTVPENFKGNLTQYTATLRLTLETGLRHQALMDVLNRQLAAFINNPEQHKSATGKLILTDRADESVVLKEYRKEAVKTLKLFFPKDTGISKAPLKSVLERFADLEALAAESRKMAYFLDMKILHSYREKVNQMIQLLDLIMKQYRSGAANGISPKMALSLSENLYDVAQYVEFIALLQYDGRVCLNVVDKVIDGLAHPKEWKAPAVAQDSDRPNKSKWFSGLQTVWNTVHDAG
jgi:hypothetical protein